MRRRFLGACSSRRISIHRAECLFLDRKLSGMEDSNGCRNCPYSIGDRRRSRIDPEDGLVWERLILLRRELAGVTGHHLWARWRWLWNVDRLRWRLVIVRLRWGLIVEFLRWRLIHVLLNWRFDVTNLWRGQVIKFRRLFHQDLFCGWLIGVSLRWRLIEVLLHRRKAFDSHRRFGNPEIRQYRYPLTLCI